MYYNDKKILIFSKRLQLVSLNMKVYEDLKKITIGRDQIPSSTYNV